VRPQQVLVHTWRDATLSEITELLAQEHRQVRQSGTKCTFKVFAPALNTSPRAFGTRRLQHAHASPISSGTHISGGVLE
jgi:hypothetical protein